VGIHRRNCRKGHIPERQVLSEDFSYRGIVDKRLIDANTLQSHGTWLYSLSLASLSFDFLRWIIGLSTSFNNKRTTGGVNEM
jgi:hypothetical protein